MPPPTLFPILTISPKLKQEREAKCLPPIKECNMKEFNVAIEETIVQNFSVLANNADEALEQAEKLYINGVFVVEFGYVQTNGSCKSSGGNL